MMIRMYFNNHVGVIEQYTLVSMSMRTMSECVYVRDCVYDSMKYILCGRLYGATQV